MSLFRSKRPNKPHPDDRPLPPKYRKIQRGVLLFKPTLADRAKLAMGFAVRVNVTQYFEHSPGHIKAEATWEVVEHLPDESMPKLSPPAQEGGSAS